MKIKMKIPANTEFIILIGLGMKKTRVVLLLVLVNIFPKLCKLMHTQKTRLSLFSGFGNSRPELLYLSNN